MRGEHWFIIVLILIEATIIVFVPSAGWNLQAILLRNRGNADTALQDAEREIAALKAAQAGGGEAVASNSFLAATVYSRYPFNLKNQLLLNAGSDRKVAEGAPVYVPPDGGAKGREILLGKIITVFAHESLVQTIFDSRFQTAVRVGATGINALLAGGAEPKLTLIAKSQIINAGDAVISAGSDFPYGTPVGTVGAVSISSDELFKEAVVVLPYDINALRTVDIDTSYVVH